MADPKLSATPNGNTSVDLAAHESDYMHEDHRVVQIGVYVETRAWGRSEIDKMVWTAANILMRHGLYLATWPNWNSRGPQFQPIQFKLAADPISSWLVNDAFEQTQREVPAPSDVLPILVFASTGDDHHGGTTASHNGRTFCVINPNIEGRPDCVTMLHEIGHAAGLAPGFAHPSWGLGRKDRRYPVMASYIEFAAGSDELKMTQDPQYFRNWLSRDDVVTTANAGFTAESGQGKGSVYTPY